MALAPIALFSDPLEDYAGYWFKAYAQGTTTPIVMAIDSTGSPTVAKAEISSGGVVPVGFLKTAGDVIFIPYVDQAYDAYLFPTESEADWNDTVNAIQLADNVDPFLVTSTAINAIASLPNLIIDSEQVTYTSPVSGSIESDVELKLSERVSVFDAMTDAEIADVQARTSLVDVSVAIESLVSTLNAAGGGAIFFPPGTYLAPDLDFTGLLGITFQGAGPNTSIIDVKGSTNAAAFRIGWDVPNGGSKDIELNRIGITDSSGVIASTRLVSFEGGPAGASPSQTSGFFTLNRFEILSYSNAAGTAHYIDGLSHVEMISCHQPFQPTYAIGLELTATNNVNTGVDSFQSSSFRGAQTGLYIHGDTQLLDSFAFAGCFIGNHDNSAALSAIWLRGENTLVSSVSFVGCHAESRSNASAGDKDAILLEGRVVACTWDSFHLSGGSSVVAEQADYGFRFKIDRDSGNSLIRANIFNGLEVLRVASAGSVFGFDGDVVTDIDEPNHIQGVMRNTTAPSLIEYLSGANEDTIRNSTFFDGEVGNRNFQTVPNNSVVSFVPRAEEGTISINTNTLIEYGGMALYDIGAAPQAILIGGGPEFEVGTGVPTGTTGTSGKLTLFADTGTLYIENRSGVNIQISTKVLSEYKVPA